MKRALIFIGSLPGVLLVFIALTSRQLMGISSIEMFNVLIEYGSQLDEIPTIGPNIMVAAIKISEYSQILITVGVVWVITFIFMWVKSKDNNKENENEKKYD